MTLQRGYTCWQGQKKLHRAMGTKLANDRKNAAAQRKKENGEIKFLQFQACCDAHAALDMFVCMCMCVCRVQVCIYTHMLHGLSQSIFPPVYEYHICQRCAHTMNVPNCMRGRC